MILPTDTLPQIGDRITDKSAPPDDSAVCQWIEQEAFKHWAKLRRWIDEFYPGVFAPDWLYGGKNRGWSLRYKKTKAFTTLVPDYRRLSAVVVMSGAEREKFEERRYVWRPQLVKLYDEAKTYIDGKWLTIAISSADDLHEVTELLTMKRPPDVSSASRSNSTSRSSRKASSRWLTA
ncbi:DUF3788 domain-containing protein [Mesorhizobium sp. B2-5-9]|uniref:DUF3788 domain-containing protein n=1 Tax=Mesorhizobium sp. B2-5-9 TaxID=2589921 RepID=UPI0011285B9E|nr:DUF3788 domain-containing protein [Mesorhizobium sp. B2-5-9]TPK16740.1 DUF3788 domain-containing protein [Mesorhizobium sp. B2-5-9]